MIDNPLYLSGITELPEVDDGALFHYTKFDSFIEIIKSMTLKSSPLSKMNDLNEASIEFIDRNKNFLFHLKAEKYIKNNCSIVCFTKNYMNGEICELGGNHPAMWAHYADDSNGVCIVLDEKSLIENNKVSLSEIFYKIEDVKYSHNCSPDDNITKSDYSDLSDFLQKNYKELFFKKHVDWSYEKETRLLIEKPEIDLNIKGAIKYIILGGRMKNDEEKVRKIVNTMVSPESLAYKYLIPQSFAQASRSPFGYFVDIASHIIYDHITKVSHTQSQAHAYMDWLNGVKIYGLE